MRISDDAWPSEELQTELERVGVTVGRPGSERDLVVLERESDVMIFEALDEPSYRSWAGSEADALDLLATLPDDAGVGAFWGLFDSP